MLFITVNDDVKKRAIEHIQSLEGVWDVEITKHKKSRSVAANRLMWMWLNLIAKETGNEPEDLHHLLKVKFLGTETKIFMGSEIERPKSTTKLNTKEFTNYLDKIETLAMSIGITLPHPEVIYAEAMR